LPRIAAMGKVGSAVARMLETYDAAHQQFYGSRLLPMHDALAIAHVIDPSLMQFEHVRVDVDCGFSIGRGATVLDRWGITGAPTNVRYARAVDSERFHLLLMDRLERFSGVD
jgi:inosine-uridine nucleoside N-ribohydrolase